MLDSLCEPVVVFVFFWGGGGGGGGCVPVDLTVGVVVLSVLALLSQYK